MVPEDQQAEVIFETCELMLTVDFDSSVINCPLEDFFDGQLVFRAIEEWIQLEAPVRVDVCIDYLDKHTVIKMSGNVTAIDPDMEGHRYITVGVEKVAAKDLDTLMKGIEVRQLSINRFFKNAYGR